MTINYSHGQYKGTIPNKILKGMKGSTVASITIPPDKFDSRKHHYRSNCLNECIELDADYLGLSSNSTKKGRYNMCDCIKVSKKNKKKFETAAADKSNAGNKGFNDSTWGFQHGSPFVIKQPNADNRMIFEIKEDVGKKTFIGYYNIENIDANNKITDFYYLTSMAGTELDDAGRINAPSIPNILFSQITSNASLMSSFIQAEQNDCELVMIYTGSDVSKPVVFIGKINSVMKDCHVDIVSGDINPFFGHLSHTQPPDGKYYKVYLRPDLKLTDVVQKNKECKRKKLEQHKILVRNSRNIQRYNANHFVSQKKTNKNIIDSMYEQGKIETFTANEDTVEYFEANKTNFSLSGEVQKNNLDTYFSAKETSNTINPDVLESKYKKQLEELNRIAGNKTDHLKALKKLDNNKQN